MLGRCGRILRVFTDQLVVSGHKCFGNVTNLDDHAVNFAHRRNLGRRARHKNKKDHRGHHTHYLLSVTSPPH